MEYRKELEGKVALITGASRGIGRCIAEEFAKRGAIVYANARREGSIEEWSEEISKKYNAIIKPVYFDVTDYEGMKNAVFEIWQAEKRFDILVNNAGVEYNEKIGMMQKSRIMEMFSVNAIALIELTQMIAKYMMRNKKGSIINLSSVVARYGASGQSVYAATKGAVISFTKSAAKELGSYGIRVNAVAPGINNTDMITSTDKEHLQKRIDNISLGRIGQPIDVANLCVYLASDVSEYVSGQVIGVDGATSM